MAGRRRKPRLFSFSREVELGNLEDVVTDPNDRHALEALVDAFLSICRTQAVTPATLAPVAGAARASSAHVRGAGITRLTVLTHYFPEAIVALQEVARDGDEEARLYACAALPNTPDDVALPLLRAALGDDSWRVRKAAAQAASAMALPALLPILDARLPVEPDARVRVVLQVAADYQRQPRGA